MLPYIDHPVWRIGPVTIHAFGIAVAAALWFGLSAATRRFSRVGIDADLGERAAWWTLMGGVLGAHLFSVLLYFPQKLQADPWALVRLWEDISSFGGVLGGLAGALLFFATRRDVAERRARLAYLDSVALVFPAALAIGRLGCALAHDHPGTVTSFPLAVSLNSDVALTHIRDVYEGAGLSLPPAAGTLGFHDLGFYEFLYLSLVVIPLFALWDRRSRPRGFYLAAFAALYLPVRFALDTLRVADARYVGLTPAQWAALLGMFAWPFVVIRNPRLRLAVGGAIVLVGALACSVATP